MTNVTDKELLNIVLSQHKAETGLLTHLAEESVNMQVREDATSLLNQSLCHQKKIFDLMTQKGWYNVENATSQDITKAQQTINQE